MRVERWMATAGILLAISLLLGPGLVGAQVERAEPSVIAAGEGYVGVSPRGVQTRFKVGSVSNGASQLTVVVGVMPPGHVSPTHLHEIDEEVVYVLQGELTAILDGEEYTVGPGGTVFIPPETWMALENRTETSVFALGVLSRGELEECFRVLFSNEADEAAQRKAQELCRLKVRPPTSSD